MTKTTKPIKINTETKHNKVTKKNQTNPTEPKKPTGLSTDVNEIIPPTPIRLVGRPRKYETPKDLQDLIQSYFDSLFEYKTLVKKEPTGFKRDGTTIYKRWIEKERVITGIPSITALQAHIGIHSRTTWAEYKSGKHGDEYTYTIEESIKIVESLIEKGGLSGKLSPMIVKFSLENNFGWENKVVTEDKPYIPTDDEQKKMDKLLKNNG